MTNESQINQFAVQQVRQLLDQFSSAEELERTVFFTKHPYRAAPPSDPAARANYAGCAYCHEVKQAAGLSYPTAEIAKPVIIDRWMPHAHFDHAKHATVASCRDCHAVAEASQLTSDVLMPTKESCATCHGPGGKAEKASSCMTCHTYHAPDGRGGTPGTASGVSFKEMALGEAR
jgi:hypothetical protein